MNISKSRIKKLILESLSKVLKEDTGDAGDTGFSDTGTSKKNYNGSPITNLMYPPDQARLKPINLGVGGIAKEYVFSSDLSGIPKNDIKSLRNFYEKNNWNVEEIGDYLFGQADFWPSIEHDEKEKMGGMGAPHKIINVAAGSREYKTPVLPVAWSATAIIFIEDYDNMIEDLLKYTQETNVSSKKHPKKILGSYVFKNYGIRFEDIAKLKGYYEFLKKSMKANDVDNLDYNPNKDD